MSVPSDGEVNIKLAEGKRRKGIGTFFICIGAAALIGATALTAYNFGLSSGGMYSGTVSTPIVQESTVVMENYMSEDLYKENGAAEIIPTVELSVAGKEQSQLEDAVMETPGVISIPTEVSSLADIVVPTAVEVYESEAVVPDFSQDGNQNPVPAEIEPSVIRPDFSQDKSVENPDLVDYAALIRGMDKVNIGSGPLADAMYSDGSTAKSVDWLWQYQHFDIQRCRQEEYPDGVGIADRDSEFIWLASSYQASLYVNDVLVCQFNNPYDKYGRGTDTHGVIIEYPINKGDKISMEPSNQYFFIIGETEDLWFHYDTYCYRIGGCG